MTIKLAAAVAATVLACAAVLAPQPAAAAAPVRCGAGYGPAVHLTWLTDGLLSIDLSDVTYAVSARRVCATNRTVTGFGSGVRVVVQIKNRRTGAYTRSDSCRAARPVSVGYRPGDVLVVTAAIYESCHGAPLDRQVRSFRAGVR